MPFEDIPSDPSLADPLPNEPFGLMQRWLDEAQASSRRNPHAMSVATVDGSGRPSSRMVLCRGFNADPGYVVFYTNRQSPKGDDLNKQPYAAAVFHWDDQQRQIRLRGPVGLSPESESDAYFSARHRMAQIAAWASDQSVAVASRKELLAALAEREGEFGTTGALVPRPAHWGGYRIFIEQIELWVGAEGRAHDRAQWQRTLRREADEYVGGSWLLNRLQP
jgi:pyridoxamine 5'-phosphate oxidase